MQKIVKKLLGLFCILSCFLIIAGCSLSHGGGGNDQHVHELEYVEAVAPTCIAEGNIAYVHCKTCDKYYAQSDVNQAKEITKQDTVLAKTGHNLSHVDGVEANCEFGGIREHYHCSTCGKNFSDQAGKNELSAVTLEPLGHKLTYVAKVEATELENGVIAHYHCSVCGKDYQDANGTVLLTSVVITATGHTLSRVTAKAATCTQDGNIAHYHCSDCGKNFEDEQGKKELSNVVIKALGHTFTKVNKVEATCEQEGVLEHYHCSVCNKDFEDDKGERELTNVVIAICGHTLSKVDKVEATCTTGGNVEYYHCSVCQKNFSDAAGKNVLDAVNVNALGHNATLVALVPATCLQDGTKAHYHCANCNKDFEDEACTKELTDLKIEKLEHVEGTATKENEVKATCTKAGHYDEVVRCTNCQTELSRKTKNTDALGHTWEEDQTKAVAATCLTAGSKTFVCSVCQEEKKESINALGHNYSATIANPTCTEKGYTVHTCANCEDSYKDTYVNATGHTWDGTATCEEGRKCTVCGLEEEALGHNYVLTAQTNADCENPGTETYTCSRCQDTYTNNTTAPLGHSISNATAEARLITGETCKYQLYYKCSRCNEDVRGQIVEQHTYVATITTEANCTTAGVKTYTCSKCGDSHTEEIPVNADAHIWVEGTEVVNGKRTDTCSLCNATKEVIVYTGGDIAAADLKDQEIAMENASLKLNEGLVDFLGDADITLSVDTVSNDEKENIGLSEDQWAQIGDKPVYNFSMESGGEAISSFNDNKITITLPYQLSEGDDVDCIAIWYINDKGEIDSIQATYANGFVTFETTHFSYYTVTRLTPAERCSLYGHNWVETEVEGDCTHDGYTLKVCQRCHETEKVITHEATGHQYEVNQELSTAVTCIKNGIEVKVCSVCGNQVRTVIKATGHDYQEVETVEATCAEDGYTEYKCSKCDKTYRDVIDALGHQYVKTTTAPTCEDYGYSTYKCSVCNDEYIGDYVEPLGHDYEAVFTFANDHLSAKVTLTCKNDQTHTVTLDAVVTITVLDATCAQSGDVVYTAKVTYEGEEYTDTYTLEGTLLPHDLGDLEYDETGHFKVCKNCKQKLEFAEHAFTDEVVLAATCGADGTEKHTCTCGYTYETKIPMTGEHNYVDGVCSVCGKVYVACDHTHLHPAYVDLADFGCCGGILYYDTCDCGEVKIFDEYHSDMHCNYDDLERDSGFLDEAHTTQFMSQTCKKCGLVIYGVGTQTKDGCKYIYNYSYKFSKGDVTILECTVEYEYESHQSTEYNRLTYTDWPFYVYYYKCNECNKVTYIGLDALLYSTAGQAANFVKAEETVNNDDGSVTEITTYTTETCDCMIVVEETTKRDGCIIHKVSSIKVYKGEEVVLSTVSEGDQTDHDFEATYELKGATCEDGYVETLTCKVCGAKYVHEGDDHNYETVVINLQEEGCCNSQISYRECKICHDIQLDFSDIWPSCNFDNPTPSKVTDENGVEHQVATYTCSDCGLTCTIDMYTISDDCYTKYYVSIKLVKGEKLIFEVKDNNIQTEESHTWGESVITYDNEVMKCNHGYKITRTCTVCGKVDVTESGGHDYEYKEIGNGYFGIHYAQCKRCGYVDYKELEHCIKYDSDTTKVVQGEDGREHQVRTLVNEQGGITLTFDSYAIIADCRATYMIKIKLVQNDQVLLETEYQYGGEGEAHDFEDVVVYNDPEIGCPSGWELTRTCKDCGKIEKDYGHDHVYSKVDYIPVVDENNVELFKIYHFVCDICKQDILRAVWYDFNRPDVVKEEISMEINGHTYTGEKVTVAGKAELIWVCYSVPLTSCTYYDINYVKVTKGDEVVYETDLVQYIEDHKFEQSVEFFNPEELCDGGYNRVYVCSVCGLTEREERYGHEFKEEYIPLGEYGMDGHIYVVVCPTCVTYREFDVEFDRSSCQYNTSESVDEYGYTHVIQTYTRADNGFEYTEERITKQLENCVLDVTFKRSVSIGDYSFTKVEKYNSTNHDFVYTYTLLGDTCEDGHMVHVTCKNCDYDVTFEEEGHAYVGGQYILYDENDDYLFQIDYSRCQICGILDEDDISYQYSNVFGDNAKENQEDVLIEGIQNTVFTLENTDLGVKFTWSWYTDTIDSCHSIDHNTITLTYNGEVKFTGELIQNLEKHELEYVPEFVDETLKCRGGVHYVATCKNCDYVEEKTLEAHWGSFTTVNLSDYEGCCGGSFRYFTCLLCKNIIRVDLENVYGYHDYTYTNNEYVEDGIRYYVDNYICDCGLKVLHKSWQSITVNCKVYTFESYLITFNDEVLLTTEWCTGQQDAHEIITIVELMPGALTCEDGVYVTRQCKNCDFYDCSTYYYHYTYEKEIIDLAQYGCVCGGTFTIYGCACGEEERYDIHLDCETDDRCNYYENPEDGVFYRYVHKHICSVTDPECGFTYYYVNEYRYHDDVSCSLDYYETYYFGITGDDYTNSRKSFTRCYENYSKRHDYVNTDVEEATTDGYVNGYREECSRCGAIRSELWYYTSQDVLVKYEVTYIDGDEYDVLTREYEELVFAGVYYNIITKEVHDCNDYHSEYIYTYPNDPCHYHRVYTCTYKHSSQIDYDENDGYNHLNEQYVNYQSATCTQFGGYGYVCTVCGEETASKLQAPLCHIFVYDENEQVYVCSVCGLKNANGATGDVVMEDLSNEDVYAIGYYNMSNVQFFVRVCILVPTTDGDKEPIILENISPEKMYDSVGLYFYKDAVEYEARELGYEPGEYEVEVVFIPKYNDSNYDYALVFGDSLPTNNDGKVEEQEPLTPLGPSEVE